jgi:hypothetical protein
MGRTAEGARWWAVCARAFGLATPHAPSCRHARSCSRAALSRTATRKVRIVTVGVSAGR